MPTGHRVALASCIQHMIGGRTYAQLQQACPDHLTIPQMLIAEQETTDPNWQPMNDYEFSRLTGEVNRLFADHCDIAHPPVCDPVELKTLHEESLRPGPTMQVPRETLISVFTSMQAAMKAMGEPEFLLPLHGAKTLQDARCDLAYHVGRLAYWLQVKVP